MAVTVNKVNFDRNRFYRYMANRLRDYGMRYTYETREVETQFGTTTQEYTIAHCIVPEIDNEFHELWNSGNPFAVSAEDFSRVINNLSLTRLKEIADDGLVVLGFLPNSWLNVQCAIEGISDLLDDDTGEVIYDDNYEVIDDLIYSRSTVERSFTRCDHCNEWVRKNETYLVNTRYGTETWCESCCDDGTFRCECCDETYSTSDYDYHSVRAYGLICDGCAEYSGNFEYCEECNEWVHIDDYDGEEDMCVWCAERRARTESLKWSIRNYHNAPQIKWFGKKDSRSKCWKGTGFELEIDNGSRSADAAKFIYDNLGDHVYFEHDGSLGGNGFEIISQPMTDKYMRDKFLPQIDYVFDKLVSDYKYRSHDTTTCGLHFHFSRELFGKGANRDRALEKFTLFFEDYWDDVVKFSRRSSSGLSWCNPYTGYFSQKEKEKDIKDMCKGKKYLGHGDRYHAVNLTNRNTVEVRIMRGTLNPDTFRAAYDFLFTLVKNSKKVKYCDRHNLAKWFKGLKPETIAYMKERNAFNAYTATVA